MFGSPEMILIEFYKSLANLTYLHVQLDLPVHHFLTFKGGQDEHKQLLSKKIHYKKMCTSVKHTSDI